LKRGENVNSRRNGHGNTDTFFIHTHTLGCTPTEKKIRKKMNQCCNQKEIVKGAERKKKGERDNREHRKKKEGER
jgi:hypothetical protein